MGPIGCGQAIKLINNHLIATSIESLAEGMLLADAMGLSRKKKYLMFLKHLLQCLNS